MKVPSQAGGMLEWAEPEPADADVREIEAVLLPLVPETVCVCGLDVREAVVSPVLASKAYGVLDALLTVLRIVSEYVTVSLDVVAEKECVWLPVLPLTA